MVNGTYVAWELDTSIAALIISENNEFKDYPSQILNSFQTTHLYFDN